MAVADVVSAKGAQYISREKVQRKIVVQTNVAGRVGPNNADCS